MKHTATISQLAAALIKARQKFSPIFRSKTVEVKTANRGSYIFKYAPLDEIQEATERALNAEEITVIQNVGADGITTMLLHSSGEYIETDPIALQPNLYGTQFGGDVTFKKRYQYSAALNLAVEDDNDADDPEVDDERNDGRPLPRTITPTTGVMDMVPVGRQEAMRRRAQGIDEAVANGDMLDAFESYETAPYVGEESVAFQSLLNSKTRTLIKKMQAAKPKPEQSPEVKPRQEI